MHETKEVLIRRAQPVDAAIVARLMYYASQNYMLAFFGKPESRAISILCRMFSLPRHTTSYTYVFVAEYEGSVVGSFSCFDGRSWQAARHASLKYGPIWFVAVPPWRIPQMVAAFGDFNKSLLPISDEEYYIEHIAVLPEKRSQRIGKQMIEFAETQARAKGLKMMTLDVEIENKRALRLYKCLGFQTVKEMTDPGYCKRFSFQGSMRMMKIVI